MRGRTTTVLFLSLLTILSPLGAAGWGAKGDLEPSTGRDATDGWMFTEPDQRVGAQDRQIYFSGFGGQYFGYVAGVSTGFNPNSATLGSAFETYPYQSFALLGVWKDCNGDGYIGLGDNMLFEYRAELLSSMDICPISLDKPKVNGYTPQHNDGQWVREFLPIGWDNEATSVNENAYNFNDTSARVWADYGVPEAEVGSTCAVRPMPRGSLQSTGGFLRYADCFTGYHAVELLELVDPDGSMGISFADTNDHNYQNSGSMLNQKNPWGVEGDDTYFAAFDCSAESTPWSVDDPTGGDLNRVDIPEDPTGASGYGGGNVTLTDENGTFAKGEIHQVSPGAPNLGGSAAGTVNETEEGIGSCDRNDDTGSNGDIYPLAGFGEGDQDGVGVNKRTQSDQSLTFTERSRGAAPGLSAVLGHGQPYDALNPDENDVTRVDWFWTGDTITGVSRNPYVNRDALGPETASYITYYAYVSPTIMGDYNMVGPSPTTGTYGAEHCDGPSPKTGAWECDPDAWYIGPDGGSLAGTSPAISGAEYSVRVGAPYNFRDVDCRDKSISALRDEGIGYGMLTSTSCE